MPKSRWAWSLQLVADNPFDALEILEKTDSWSLPDLICADCLNFDGEAVVLFGQLVDFHCSHSSSKKYLNK